MATHIWIISEDLGGGTALARPEPGRPAHPLARQSDGPVRRRTADRHRRRRQRPAKLADGRAGPGNLRAFLPAPFARAQRGPGDPLGQPGRAHRRRSCGTRSARPRPARALPHARIELPGVPGAAAFSGRADRVLRRLRTASLGVRAVFLDGLRRQPADSRDRHPAGARRRTGRGATGSGGNGFADSRRGRRIRHTAWRGRRTDDRQPTLRRLGPRPWRLPRRGYGPDDHSAARCLCPGAPGVTDESHGGFALRITVLGSWFSVLRSSFRSRVLVFWRSDVRLEFISGPAPA